MRDHAQLESHLLTFFGSLSSLAPLLRHLSQDGLTMTLALRHSLARICFDLRSRPPRVSAGGAELPFVFGLAVSAVDLHDLLLGRGTLLGAIGERRVLIRGSLGRLVAFFPIFELARPMYAAYLSRVDVDLAPASTTRRTRIPLGLRAAGARSLERTLRSALVAQGKALASLSRGETLDLVEGLAEGLARWSLPDLQPLERSDGFFGAHRLLLPPSPSPRRVAALNAARAGMVGIGRAVGTLAYGAEVPVDAVALLRHVARGVVEGERAALIKGSGRS